MLHDLRFALRLLLSQPGFTTSVILTLGLGIGASTAAYSLVDAVLLKPLPYPDSDRIMSLTVRGRGGDVGVSGGVLDAVGKLPSVEAAAGSVGIEQSLVHGTELTIVRGSLVMSRFFDVFRAQPLLGRTLGSAPANVGEIVLGERLWRSQFASDPQIVGRAIRLDDQAYTVVGVMPRTFANPEEASYWRPYEVSGDEHARIGPGPFRAVARLRDFGIAAAQAEADALGAALALTMGGERATISLTPYRETVAGPYRRTLTYLGAAVALVLLIACANAGHLVLARTLGRAQELGVRTAIGATRMQIVRQLLVESSVLAAASGLAGIVIAWLLMRAIPSIAYPGMPRLTEVALDTRVLAFAVAACSASVVCIGFCPAWLSNLSGESQLGSRTATSRTARRAVTLMVTLEIAVTLMLVICGGLAAVTLVRRLSVDVGFDPRSLSLVALRPSGAEYGGSERSQYFERVTDAVRRAPGVESVALTSHIPLTKLLAANAPASSESEGKSPPVSVGARARMIGPGTFAALRVPVLKGREFEPTDRAGSEDVAIVNRAMAARLWRDADPVGKVVRAPAFDTPGTATYRVIGVVGDIRGSLLRQPEPEIYISALQRPPRTMHLMIRSALGPSAVDAIVREAIGAIDPRHPGVSAMGIQTLYQEATAYNRFAALWLIGFASFGLMLAVGGILAIVMRAVVTRTRELGIRAAIGATPSQQVAVIMRDLLIPFVVGSGLGVTAAYNLSTVALRAMSIERFDAGISVIAVVAVACVSGFAAWIPARRAARINPVRVLQAS